MVLLKFTHCRFYKSGGICILNQSCFSSYLMHIKPNPLDCQFYDLLRTEYHI